ncbi:MAG: outer membrane beta-barrel protein [Hyphomicrobiaceae bacterium]
MRRAAIALSILCLFLTEAHAADLYRPPADQGAYEPAAGPYNWTGLYTGAFAGSAHSIWTIDFFRNNNHGHAELSSDGFAAGGYVGYNWHMWPRLVVGVEGDLGFTNASQHNEIFDNDHTDSQVGMFGTLRGRAGYTFGRMLVYGTAGLAFADIDQNIQKGRNAGEQVVSEGSRSYGYVVGGGVEYAFDRNWLGRVEYLYSNYGMDTFTNRDGNRADFANDMSLVRVGLAYKF